MIRAGLCSIILALCTACATQTVDVSKEAFSPGADDNLHGVLWMQTSVEYAVATQQTYHAALASIDEALADTSWTAALEQAPGYERLPPAIIVDVDETILDNSPFQARLIRDGEEFSPSAWKRWVNEAAARPLPGAREFLEAVRKRGVEIFYVTNRELEAPTVANLQAVIDPAITPDVVMCKAEQPDWGSDKTSRRSVVASTHRVLVLLGDDYNDFAYLGQSSPIERKRKAADQHQSWGVSWFILPNPVYGSFERSLYGYEYALSHAAKRARKHTHLDTAD